MRLKRNEKEITKTCIIRHDSLKPITDHKFLSMRQTITLSSIAVFFSLSLYSFAQSEESHTIKSSFLDEDRTIKVSLPRSYEYSGNDYPVLYVLDGEWVYSYAKGTVEFMSSDITGYIPEMIVVGVPNTSRYRDMQVTFKEGDPYSKFMDFIEKELKTFIDKKYRANDLNLIYGWSGGSGIVSQFFFERPQVFKGYINSGSGMGPRTYAFASENLPKHQFTKTHFYVNAEGESPRRVAGVRLTEKLLDSLALEGVSYKAEIIEDQSHLDVLATGVFMGLKYIFRDFMLTEELVSKGADGILSHFSSLISKFNCNILMPEGAIVEGAFLLEQSEQPDEAIKLLEKGAELYPYSSDIQGALGETYFWRDELELSKKHYQKALERAKKQNKFLEAKYQTILDDL